MRLITTLVLLVSLTACKPGPSKGCEPGLLESWDSEVSHGRLTAREYIRHGLGENGTQVFTQLLFNGAVVDTGGCISHISLCDDCDERTGEAVVGIAGHPDPAKKGLVVFQVVNGAIQQRQLCPETTGLIEWQGQRYMERACRWAYYDAEQHEVVNLLTMYPSIPRLPLPDLDPNQRARIESALDTLRDKPVTWARKPGTNYDVVVKDLPEPVMELLPLGDTLTPFVVARLDPTRFDEAFWLVLTLRELRATEARLSVAVLRAHLAASGEHNEPEGQCEEFLKETGGWP